MCVHLHWVGPEMGLAGHRIHPCYLDWGWVNTGGGGVRFKAMLSGSPVGSLENILKMKDKTMHTDMVSSIQMNTK